MMRSHETMTASTERFLRGLVLMVTTLFLSSAAAQPADLDAAGKTAGFTAEEHLTCLYCHNLERMTAVENTAHGNKENPDTPIAQHECESCHGPGDLHVTRLRLNQARVPMIEYGPEAATPFSKQSQTCLDNCHGKDMGELKAMEWNDSVHARTWQDADGQTKEMSCVNCHKLHEQDVLVKDRTQQAQICYQCHEKTEREHPRFEDKGIVYDRLTCWDCHDVHQLIYQGTDAEGG